MEIMKVQRKVQKLYAEVGEYVYGEYAMERTVTLETPFLKDRMTAISQMKTEIREMEQEIEVTRKTQPPKHEGQEGTEEQHG